MHSKYLIKEPIGCVGFGVKRGQVGTGGLAEVVNAKGRLNCRYDKVSVPGQ